VSPPPGAFLQATRATDTLLAGLVMTGIGKARRVADLFAGLGTLSIPMASQARVLAVDSDPELLKALGDGIARVQGLKPVDRLRRDLFRDPLSPRELDGFDAVVLDPPRAGASAQSAALVRSKVKRVVMVSCNPGTLQRDLATLVGGGFRLERAVAIDQFLFTPHLEAVAVLSRR
jgi:23S rRNA (uracil1939-C5)-methyltransferase